MATPDTPHFPHQGDDFEMFVDYYLDVDGTNAKPGPIDPVILKELEADRENIERFVAWTKREQEKLNAQRRPGVKPRGEPQVEEQLDTNDGTDLNKAG